MTDAQWSEIKHFSKSDNWGDPEKIDFKLVSQLDALRDFVATPIHVCCGTNLQHLEDSQHYLGLATDVMFPWKTPADLLDLFHAACRFGFNGIGVYPSWQFSGVTRGGLHLDVRDAPYRALWMGVEDNGKQVYTEVSLANLRKYGLA